MKHFEKNIIFVTLIFLVLAFVLFEIDHFKGRRTDPFRCSDAKEYFHKVGVEVDCQKIEKEVND